jgi:hypothetical protein
MFGSLFILLLVLLIPFTLPRASRSAFLVVMFARLFVSLANVWLDGQMIGADADANKFFEDAVSRSSDLQSLDWSIDLLFGGTHAFVNVHAILQAILGGPDFFLSHTFSLLGSAACLWLLVKIWYLLSLGKKRKGIWSLLVIYSFIPSVLTNQSYILREVWQSLCPLVLLYLGLSIRIKGWSLPRISGLLVFSLVGAFLHRALPLVMPLLLVMSIMIANGINLENITRKPAKLVLLIVSSLAVLAIVSPILALSSDYGSLENGSLAQNADTYTANAGQDARAEYGKIFTMSNPLSIVPCFLAYELMPIPGKIATIPDAVLFLENILRLFLIYTYWRRRSDLTQFQRSICDVILAMWFVQEFVWSIGTINWGTAARHHVPGVAFLLICGLLAPSIPSKSPKSKYKLSNAAK